MIKYENECVGCHSELGCLGRSCPYINVPHLFCDRCENEVEELKEYSGEQVCIDCLLKEFTSVVVE